MSTPIFISVRTPKSISGRPNSLPSTVSAKLMDPYTISPIKAYPAALARFRYLRTGLASMIMTKASMPTAAAATHRCTKPDPATHPIVAVAAAEAAAVSADRGYGRPRPPCLAGRLAQLRNLAAGKCVDGLAQVLGEVRKVIHERSEL